MSMVTHTLGCLLVLSALAAPLPPCAQMDQGYEDPSVAEVSGNFTASAAECQESCFSDPDCALFTWYSNIGVCYLYPAGMKLETVPGAISGPRHCLATTTLGAKGLSTTQRPVPPLSAASCLLYYGNGCPKITSRDLCLSTRDGRPFQELEGRLTAGQPCVWCGGGPCGVVHKSGVEDTTLCQPFDWVRESFQLNPNFTIAACEFGKSLPTPVLDTPEANPSVTFDRIGQTCRGESITDAGRRNNNYYWVWTANTLRQCMAFCTQKEMCTGIEYNAANNYCEVWWKDIQWSQNTPDLGGYECYRASAPPVWDHPELRCLNLTHVSGGCGSIANSEECLSQRDGRKLLKWNGLRIRGEPCVWCGGGACTDRNGNLCETRDYLLHGEGTVFKTFLARDHHVIAGCAAPTAEPAPVSRFVAGEEGLFWVSANGGQKHLVPSDLNCTECGCRGTATALPASYMDAIPTGEPFSCALIRGFGTVPPPPNSALGFDTDFGNTAVNTSTNFSNITTALVYEQHRAGGRPWWLWLLALGTSLLLCCIIGAILAYSRKPRKKRKRVAPAHSDSSGSDQETSRLIVSEGHGSNARQLAQHAAEEQAGASAPLMSRKASQFAQAQPQSTGQLQAMQMMQPPPYFAHVLPPPPMAGIFSLGPAAAGPPPGVNTFSLGPVFRGASVGSVPAGVSGPRGSMDMASTVAVPPEFHLMDRNQDGSISREEFMQAYEGSLRPIQLVQGLDPRLAAGRGSMLGP